MYRRRRYMTSGGFGEKIEIGSTIVNLPYDRTQNPSGVDQYQDGGRTVHWNLFSKLDLK